MRKVNFAGDGTARWGRSVTAVLGASMVIGGLFLAGCADQPKPAPGQKEIRSDSDRFFERVKQEENERGKDAEGATR